MSDIAQVLKLVTQLDSKGIDELGSKLDSTSEKGGKLSGALGAAGKAALGLGALGAGGLIAGLGASVHQAADFEQALNGVQAATGATNDEMQTLRATAIQVGKDTSKSASDTVAAFGELVKAGVSVTDVVAGVGKSTVQLAESQGKSVEEMATLMSNSLNTFQDSLNRDFATPAERGAHVADLLAKAANASAIDVGDLQFSLAAVGPVAAQAGLTMDDFATAIGIMGNHALKGSDAGTSLKTMLLALTAPTSNGAAALDYLGVSAFDANGKVRGFRDILGDLQAKTKDMSDEEKSGLFRQIFGQDAIRAANILIGEGTDGWDKFQDTMAKAPSVADQTATRLKGLNGTLTTLKSSLSTLAINVGTVFLPALTKGAAAALDFVNNQLLTLDPNKLLAKLQGFAQPLQQLFTGLRRMINDQFGGFLDLFFDQHGFTLGPAAALLAGQIVPLFDAVRAQVQAKVGAITDWLFGDQGAGSGSRFDAIAGFVTDKLLPAFAAIGDVLLTKVAPALASLFSSGFQERMQVIGDLVAHLLVPALAQLAEFVVKSVLPAVLRFTDWLGTTAIPAVQALQTELVTTILPALDKLADFVVRVVLPPLLQLSDWLLNTVVPALAELVGAILEKVLPTFDRWLHQITDEILPKWIELASLIIGKAQEVIAWITEHWSEIYAVIKPVLDVIRIEFNNTWDNIQTVLQTALKVIGDILQFGIDLIKGNWSGAWNDIKQIVIDIWNGIKQLADNTWKEIRDLITGPIGEVVSALGDKAGGLLGSIWGGVTGVFHDIWQWLTDHVEDLKTALLTPFRWFGDHVGEAVHSGINSVMGLLHGFLGKVDDFTQGIIDAVNWVTGHLGLGNVLNPNPFKYASLVPERLAKGTANWGGGYAWVGEGPGGAGAELAYLPPGASVLPHAQSMGLVRQGLVAPPTGAASGPGMRLPGFLFGLDPGDILSAFKGAASAVVSFAREWIAKGAGALLDHALEQFGVADMLPKDGVLGKLGGGLFSTLKDALVDGVKQLLQLGDKALPQVVSVSVNLPGEVSDWLNAAAQLALGRDLTAAELNAMLWLVGQESGGNPGAVNPVPVGNEHATGLLQTLPSTFAANMVAGHGNILNPVDNAAAAMRYILRTYGDLTIPAAREQAGAQGYADGGIIDEEIVGVGLTSGKKYRFGEKGDEVIIPLTRASAGTGPQSGDVYGSLASWGWKVTTLEDLSRGVEATSYAMQNYGPSLVLFQQLLAAFPDSSADEILNAMGGITPGDVRPGAIDAVVRRLGGAATPLAARSWYKTQSGSYVLAAPGFPGEMPAGAGAAVSGLSQVGTASQWVAGQITNLGDLFGTAGTVIHKTADPLAAALRRLGEEGLTPAQLAASGFSVATLQAALTSQYMAGKFADAGAMIAAYAQNIVPGQGGPAGNMQTSAWGGGGLFFGPGSGSAAEIAAQNYLDAQARLGAYGTNLHSGGAVGMYRMAAGGIISEPVAGLGLLSGSRYLLGEAGPERVSPLSGPAAQGNVTIVLQEGAIKVDAANLHEVQDVLDLFDGVVQVARANGARS